MSEEIFDHRHASGEERREGYSSVHRNAGGERPRFVRKDRMAGGEGYRPRFNNTYGAPRSNGERPSAPRYSSGYNSDDTQRPAFRPRFNDGQGGYRPRQDYNGYNATGRNTGGGQGGYHREPRQYGRDGEQRGFQGGDRFGKRSPYAASRYPGQQPRQGGYGRPAGYGNTEDRTAGISETRSYGRSESTYGRSYNRNSGYQQNRPYGQQEGYTQAGEDFKKRPARQGNYDPHAKYSAKKRREYKEKNYDPNEPVRLNKFLANSGICSRREADKHIAAGVVTVNGQVVTELGAKVLRTDTVLFHDQAVKMEKKVYVLLNKPKGYVTTSDDPQNRKTVMDLVTDACSERIYPVGRLDKNTTGVLLLTNDGELADKLMHPKFLKKKVYHVHTDSNVTAADLHQIAEGITLEDGEIKADAVEYASPTDKKQVGIEIHSGKNRIVRRIFEHLGYHVVKLDRVYFAGLTKKNVRRGDWRFLTEKEVEMLYMGAYE